MTTLKIRHGSESGSEAPRNQARPQPHADGNQEHSQRNNRAGHALDNMPARHRELETQGNHTRAKVDRSSDSNDGGRQSRQSDSSVSLGRIGDKVGKILGGDKELQSRFQGDRNSQGPKTIHGNDQHGPNANQVNAKSFYQGNTSRGEGRSSQGEKSSHANGQNSSGPKIGRGEGQNSQGQRSSYGNGPNSSGPKIGRGNDQNSQGQRSSYGNGQNSNGPKTSRGNDQNSQGSRFNQAGERTQYGQRSSQADSHNARGSKNNQPDGDFDAHFKTDYSSGSHGKSHTHGEGDGARNSRNISDFRPSFQRTSEREGPQRQSEVVHDSKHILNETLKSVRQELKAVRSETKSLLHENENHSSRNFEKTVNRINEGLENRLRPSDRLANNRSSNQPLRETFRQSRVDLRSLSSENRNSNAHETFGLSNRQIERVSYIVSQSIESRLQQGLQPERNARLTARDVLSFARLDDHFSFLERTGGEPVRQAYRVVMEFLLRDRESDPNRFWLANELLRDLRSGAFLYPQDVEGPFPLTGRARVVSEMIALSRTLDAIDRFAEMAGSNPRAGLYSILFGLLQESMAGSKAAELLRQALTFSDPTLPGLAGRLEIQRLVSANDGLLTDSSGRPLLTLEGKALRLGDLQWFNTLADSNVWMFDRFPTRLSPLFVHGFDAVYSLIGFDGRALSLPHFMAIQSQINASEFEWLFGQAPLSEGWVRSAIEFLKDSISFDYNVLGEMLEEALASGRFHMCVMRGTVEEGRPVPGSFSFANAELAPIGR